MKRILALVKRIFVQLRHDKRTLALMFIAPILILSLIYFILDGSAAQLSVAVTNAPSVVEQHLSRQQIIVRQMSESRAHDALLDGEVLAVVGWENGQLRLDLDASDASKAQKIRQAVMAALGASTQAAQPMQVHYVYGYEGMSLFDNFGAVLIGFIVFFLVFIVAGIVFLQERTSGTLEKLLSTPIKRGEVVAGYTIGFGLLTVAQAFLIAWYNVYVLHVLLVGSFWLVMLIALLTALAALTLGMMISTLADNEFQMMQFIPIIILPQFFFSGLFDLSPILAALGRIMPLYYSAEALGNVMLKGQGLDKIAGDLLALTGFSVICMVLNARLLKRYRQI